MLGDLTPLGEMNGSTLRAKDGDAGRTRDFLLDDRYWAVRFLVADTGSWLPGRKLLLSPLFIDESGTDDGAVSVKLSRETIENGPKLDEHAPVSRLAEHALREQYGYPASWLGADAFRGLTTLVGAPASLDLEQTMEAVDASDESHLRSSEELRGYRVHGSDGEIGKLDEFLVDTTSWRVHWLVVGLEGEREGVLIAPRWITRVSWPERSLEVGLGVDAARARPRLRPIEKSEAVPAVKPQPHPV